MKLVTMCLFVGTAFGDTVFTQGPVTECYHESPALLKGTDDDVCGITPFKANYRTCRRTRTVAESEAVCAFLGSRLCTAQEVYNGEVQDETKATGCLLDNRYIFVSDKCTFKGKEYNLQVIASGEGNRNRCTRSSRANLRCCFDMNNGFENIYSNMSYAISVSNYDEPTFIASIRSNLGLQNNDAIKVDRVKTILSSTKVFFTVAFKKNLHPDGIDMNNALSSIKAIDSSWTSLGWRMCPDIDTPDFCLNLPTFPACEFTLTDPCSNNNLFFEQPSCKTDASLQIPLYRKSSGSTGSNQVSGTFDLAKQIQFEFELQVDRASKAEELCSGNDECGNYANCQPDGNLTFAFNNDEFVTKIPYFHPSVAIDSVLLHVNWDKDVSLTQYFSSYSPDNSILSAVSTSESSFTISNVDVSNKVSGRTEVSCLNEGTKKQTTDTGQNRRGFLKGNTTIALLGFPSRDFLEDGYCEYFYGTSFLSLASTAGATTTTYTSTASLYGIRPIPAVAWDATESVDGRTVDMTLSADQVTVSFPSYIRDLSESLVSVTYGEAGDKECSVHFEVTASRYNKRVVFEEGEFLTRDGKLTYANGFSCTVDVPSGLFLLLLRGRYASLFAALTFKDETGSSKASIEYIIKGNPISADGVVTNQPQISISDTKFESGLYPHTSSIAAEMEFMGKSPSEYRKLLVDVAYDARGRGAPSQRSESEWNVEGKFALERDLNSLSAKIEIPFADVYRPDVTKPVLMMTSIDLTLEKSESESLVGSMRNRYTTSDFEKTCFEGYNHIQGDVGEDDGIKFTQLLHKKASNFLFDVSVTNYVDDINRRLLDEDQVADTFTEDLVDDMDADFQSLYNEETEGILEFPSRNLLNLRDVSSDGTSRELRRRRRRASSKKSSGKVRRKARGKRAKGAFGRRMLQSDFCDKIFGTFTAQYDKDIWTYNYQGTYADIAFPKLEADSELYDLDDEIFFTVVTTEENFDARRVLLNDRHSTRKLKNASKKAKASGKVKRKATGKKAKGAFGRRLIASDTSEENNLKIEIADGVFTMESSQSAGTDTNAGTVKVADDSNGVSTLSYVSTYTLTKSDQIELTDNPADGSVKLSRDTNTVGTDLKLSSGDLEGVDSLSNVSVQYNMRTCDHPRNCNAGSASFDAPGTAFVAAGSRRRLATRASITDGADFSTSIGSSTFQTSVATLPESTDVKISMQAVGGAGRRLASSGARSVTVTAAFTAVALQFACAGTFGICKRTPVVHTRSMKARNLLIRQSADASGLLSATANVDDGSIISSYLPPADDLVVNNLLNQGVLATTSLVVTADNRAGSTVTQTSNIQSNQDGISAATIATMDVNSLLSGFSVPTDQDMKVTITSDTGVSGNGRRLTGSSTLVLDVENTGAGSAGRVIIGQTKDGMVTLQVPLASRPSVTGVANMQSMDTTTIVMSSTIATVNEQGGTDTASFNTTVNRKLSAGGEADDDIADVTFDPVTGDVSCVVPLNQIQETAYIQLSSSIQPSGSGPPATLRSRTNVSISGGNPIVGVLPTIVKITKTGKIELTIPLSAGSKLDCIATDGNGDEFKVEAKGEDDDAEPQDVIVTIQKPLNEPVVVIKKPQPTSSPTKSPTRSPTSQPSTAYPTSLPKSQTCANDCSKCTKYECIMGTRNKNCYYDYLTSDPVKCVSYESKCSGSDCPFCPSESACSSNLNQCGWLDYDQKCDYDNNSNPSSFPSTPPSILQQEACKDFAYNYDSRCFDNTFDCSAAYTIDPYMLVPDAKILVKGWYVCPSKCSSICASYATEAPCEDVLHSTGNITCAMLQSLGACDELAPSIFPLSMEAYCPATCSMTCRTPIDRDNSCASFAIRKHTESIHEIPWEGGLSNSFLMSTPILNPSACSDAVYGSFMSDICPLSCGYLDNLKLPYINRLNRPCAAVNDAVSLENSGQCSFPFYVDGKPYSSCVDWDVLLDVNPSLGGQVCSAVRFADLDTAQYGACNCPKQSSTRYLPLNQNCPSEAFPFVLRSLGWAGTGLVGVFNIENLVGGVDIEFQSIKDRFSTASSIDFDSGIIWATPFAGSKCSYTLSLRLADSSYADSDARFFNREERFMALNLVDDRYYFYSQAELDSISDTVVEASPAVFRITQPSVAIAVLDGLSPNSVTQVSIEVVSSGKYLYVDGNKLMARTVSGTVHDPPSYINSASSYDTSQFMETFQMVSLSQPLTESSVAETDTSKHSFLFNNCASWTNLFQINSGSCVYCPERIECDEIGNVRKLNLSGWVNALYEELYTSINIFISFGLKELDISTINITRGCIPIPECATSVTCLLPGSATICGAGDLPWPGSDYT